MNSPSIFIKMQNYAKLIHKAWKGFFIASSLPDTEVLQGYGHCRPSLSCRISVIWTLLPYRRTSSWCHIDPQRELSLSRRFGLLQRHGLVTQTARKEERNSIFVDTQESLLKLLVICFSVRLLQLMNCRIIRSFPSTHTSWILFRSRCDAAQLLIMWATLSDAGNSNMKQTREAELRWARPHLAEPKGLCQGCPSTPQCLYDRQWQSQAQTFASDWLMTKK